MLSKNKEEITDYTLELAKAILTYRNTGRGNSRITLVEDKLFGTTKKNEFLQVLTELITDVAESELIRFKQLKDEVHLMTNEEFTYFSTLLKFDYTYEKRNQ